MARNINIKSVIGKAYKRSWGNATVFFVDKDRALIIDANEFGSEIGLLNTVNFLKEFQTKESFDRYYKETSAKNFIVTYTDAVALLNTIVSKFNSRYFDTNKKDIIISGWLSLDETKYQKLHEMLKQLLARKTDRNIKVFMDDQVIDPAVFSALSGAYDLGYGEGKKNVKFN